MKKKIIISIAVVLAVVVCAGGMWVYLNREALHISGRMDNVIITEKTLSDDGNTLTIKTMVGTSMGYVKTYKAVQDGRALYITFYQTPGLNNGSGAKNEFDIDVTSINYVYYYTNNQNDSSNGYSLAWQRNS